MVRLFELLGKRSTLKLLRYFLEHPTEKIHAQLLCKKLKISRKAMLDGLHDLADGGLLGIEEIGRTKQYHLSRDDPIARQLKILYTLDIVRPLLTQLEGTGAEAYLFGSAARGEDTEASDIDVLIIGSIGRGEALGKVKTSERLKPLYMTFMEYSALARKDKAFYERIEKDRIRLI